MTFIQEKSSLSPSNTNEELVKRPRKRSLNNDHRIVVQENSRKVATFKVAGHFNDLDFGESWRKSNSGVRQASTKWHFKNAMTTSKSVFSSPEVFSMMDEEDRKGSYGKGSESQDWRNYRRRKRLAHSPVPSPENDKNGICVSSSLELSPFGRRLRKTSSLQSTSSEEGYFTSDSISSPSSSSISLSSFSSLSLQSSEMTDSSPSAIEKYWNQRYRLFSKYDEGIELDEESWFSVTPEVIARHIAERCKCSIIVDGFCGAGGNSIQFAMKCTRVIAVDIDPRKVELARHNAKVYGVEDKIEFIVGDFFKVVPGLVADVIFLSPPWGGPQYTQRNVYNLQTLGGTMDGLEAFKVAEKISKNIAYYVPRNTNVYQLAVLAGEYGEVEVEQQFINKKLKTVTAYFGDLCLGLEK